MGRGANVTRIPQYAWLPVHLYEEQVYGQREGRTTEAGTRALACVDIAAVPNEVYRERMLVRVHRIDDSIITRPELAKALKFARECLRRKGIEVL